MKKQHNGFTAAALIVACGMASACTSVSSSTRRTGLVAVGTAAGGAAGYALGHDDPAKAVAGAVAGAALTHLALGDDADVAQEGFDRGYVQGQSDAIKRQYFLRHALEERPPAAATTQGETVYYVMPGPEVTVDGRKLEPHKVAVRVVE